jgi:signal peptidase I
MVNLLLIALCALTLVAWLVQELFGRGQQERRVLRQLEQGGALVLDESGVEPGWSDWLFRILLLLWIGWIVTAVMIKDGDFALVLVLLTLLSGVVAGLDRLLFEPRRRRFADNPPVVDFLQRFPEPQREESTAKVAGQRAVAEYSRSFFPVLALVLVLRSFIVEPFQIPSSSMVPTLEIGDYILVNKFAYGLRLPVLQTKILEVGEPQRGDVMVFFPPDDKRYFIKRVIGLPGDRIEYRNKVLFINGEQVPQTLLAELPPMRPTLALAAEKLGDTEYLIHKDLRIDRGDFAMVVEPGHYFMMGDNRDNSSDSRFWGTVPERNIVGKAFAIWMHWGSFRELPSFSRVGAIN